ncbi:MAG TPA: O-antigen ligase family protein, partial [Sphingomicrobium sp.]|nr:O-antigen ligase family protein [Sphingomicrobium sp.]
MFTIFDRDRAASGLLALFVTLCFLLGGSARDDVLSLLLLRPLSALAFAVGVAFAWSSGALRRYRPLIFLAAALPALAVIQLIPLPPAIWSSMAGRDLLWRIGEVAGIEQPWRPISVVPYRTWNSVWSALAPLAVLLLVLTAGRETTRRTVILLAGIILASGLLGLLQAIQAPGNGFYLYRVTNPDSAVGLFANRNHQAMFLALSFPLFAAVASLAKGSRESMRPKLYVAIGMSILIMPFILVTGSRAGLALALVGIASAFFIYRDPSAARQTRRETVARGYRGLIVVGLGALLLIAFLLAARASAIQRLFAVDPVDDLRFAVWGPIWHAALGYYPWGSGIGTFVEVYRIIEPDWLLGPRYLNHAHNDWLELLLTGGLGGLAIAIWAAVMLVPRIVRAFAINVSAPHESIVIRRLAASIVAILALGSAYDY